jgi:hypothetical protein
MHTYISFQKYKWVHFTRKENFSFWTTMQVCQYRIHSAQGLAVGV